MASWRKETGSFLDRVINLFSLTAIVYVHCTGAHAEQELDAVPLTIEVRSRMTIPSLLRTFLKARVDGLSDILM